MSDIPELVPQADPIDAGSSQPASHGVFLGPSGLRSGWRLALYLLLFGLTLVTIGYSLQHGIPHHTVPPVWGQMIAEIATVISAFVPAIIMARIEKRPLGAYGLPRAGAFGKQFWVGTIWGFASLSLLLLFIRGAHGFSLAGLALHGPRILKYAAFWGLFFLLVAFFEEFFFRGYTLFTLTQGIGFWPSALIFSFIFGAVHLGNKGEAWIGALAAGLIGLFFCLTLYRTGTLWWAIGFHAAWDWAESYFYSVPDSGTISQGHLLNTSFHGSRWITGGTVGPEGSVFALIVIAMLWIMFSYFYPKKETPSSATVA
jgi:membrane protease YdiL (CAAX protease family)